MTAQEKLQEIGQRCVDLYGITIKDNIGKRNEHVYCLKDLVRNVAHEAIREAAEVFAEIAKSRGDYKTFAQLHPYFKDAQAYSDQIANAILAAVKDLK